MCPWQKAPLAGFTKVDRARRVCAWNGREDAKKRLKPRVSTEGRSKYPIPN